MTTQELLYEGKSKKIFKTERAGEVIQEFKDSITGGNGAKKETLPGKGALNARICEILFNVLLKEGVPIHFIAMESQTRMRVRRLDIVPVEVIVRNRAAGSFSKRLGIEEGRRFSEPIVGFHLKNDALHDPVVTEQEMLVLGLCRSDDVSLFKKQALEINRILGNLFYKAGMELVDFKLEFGRDTDGKTLLADEISPDSCRLWDLKTQEKMDKDRFRRDMGRVLEFYEEIKSRLEKCL